MAEAFDPYWKWLGIPPAEQPPHYYRLLGIALFEADLEVISNAADRQMAHIRTFQGGKAAAESQRILNELSLARVCLLTASRKAEYDQQLRQRLPPPQPPVQSSGGEAPSGEGGLTADLWESPAEEPWAVSSQSAWTEQPSQSHSSGIVLPFSTQSASSFPQGLEGLAEGVPRQEGSSGPGGERTPPLAPLVPPPVVTPVAPPLPFQPPAAEAAVTFSSRPSHPLRRRREKSISTEMIALGVVGVVVLVGLLFWALNQPAPLTDSKPVSRRPRSESAGKAHPSDTGSKQNSKSGVSKKDHGGRTQTSPAENRPQQGFSFPENLALPEGEPLPSSEGKSHAAPARENQASPGRGTSPSSEEEDPLSAESKP